jgi:hypothetical protein
MQMVCPFYPQCSPQLNRLHLQQDGWWSVNRDGTKPQHNSYQTEARATQAPSLPKQSVLITSSVHRGAARLAARLDPRNGEVRRVREEQKVTQGHGRDHDQKVADVESHDLGVLCVECQCVVCTEPCTSSYSQPTQPEATTKKQPPRAPPTASISK